MSLPRAIRITEVGPRDGLQNEPDSVATADKVAFVDLLSRSGVREIEVSSFVSPKWVPQLGDAADVLESITRSEGVVYSALVPNERGMERAMKLCEAGRLDKIAVFTAASETFAQKNTNAGINETIERFRPVVSLAKQENLPVRAYVSCAVACPFEGPIDPRQVREVSQRLLELGLDVHSDDIDLGDTIGVATPNDIERLYDELDGLLEPADTTLHLHDTRGTALACVLRALQIGVESFDASCAGLGGCPYAPGATGNLATEDLVYMCERLGCDSGVSLEDLFKAGRHIANVMGRRLPGRVFNADGAG